MSRNKKDKHKLNFSPFYTILLLTIIILVSSYILSLLGFDAQKANIVDLQNPDSPYGVELSLVTVKNALSYEGFQFILKNITTNINLFKPLILMLISLIGFGIGEASGLFKYWFYRFKKIKLSAITLLVLFISIISSFLGMYSYFIVLPLIAVFYKHSERNPVLGILTAFIGMTIGHGASLAFDYNDYILGIITQTAGNIQRNNDYLYSLNSTIFIKLGSTIILTLFGLFGIKKFLFPKLGRKVALEEEIEINSSMVTNVSFILMMLILIYSVIPGLPLSGLLLDNTKTLYVDKLMSSNSLFNQSIIYIVSIILMITSFIYGFLNGQFKSSHDYHRGLSKGLENIGPLFVVVFFGIQMIELFNWTNIGTVSIAKAIDLLSAIQISGMPLILAFIIIVFLAGLVNPVSNLVWPIVAPVAVPLFMRANITPDFSQFIFTSISGIAYSMTPLFLYLLLMVGFVQKYSDDDDVNIFGTIRLMLPIILIMIGAWLLIIFGWYVIGLPIGTGTYPTI
jgi:aminobenzoyl-glutamate transport protein